MLGVFEDVNCCGEAVMEFKIEEMALFYSVGKQLLLTEWLHVNVIYCISVMVDLQGESY